MLFSNMSPNALTTTLTAFGSIAALISVSGKYRPTFDANSPAEMRLADLYDEAQIALKCDKRAFRARAPKSIVINARNSELRRLAEILTYKADIYTPKGRLYAFDAKFSVRDGKLFHGQTELDPSKLTDGHGRLITSDY